jgi:hypothetical protein
MPMTTKERVRAVRERRRRREILVRLVLHEDDLRTLRGRGPTTSMRLQPTRSGKRRPSVFGSAIGWRFNSDGFSRIVRANSAVPRRAHVRDPAASILNKGPQSSGRTKT